MPKDQLELSVIIATYNRAFSLQETLRDLSRQVTQEGDFLYEVIIVDNNSTDNTKTLVEESARIYPVSLIYAFEPQRGKVFALNTGLSRASGDIIAITDDDVRLAPTWLATIRRTFHEFAADGVGGPVKPLWVGPRPQWLNDRLVRQLGVVDHGPELFRVRDISKVFIGPNAAWKRSLFQTLGAFDERRVNNSEDTEWFQRVFQAGYTLIYQPDMVVFNKIDPTRWTRRTMAQRFFRQGRACALGLQEDGTARSICRVPLWVMRFFLGLHWQALKCWLRGAREEALWHWLRRYFYLGAIAYCFKDWLERRPMQRPRPAILQNAPSASLKT